MFGKFNIKALNKDKETRAKNYKHLVTYYYDVITEPYKIFWGDFFHPAIFRNSAETIEEALDYTHKLIVGDLKISNGGTIIDLGCGIGTLSILLAKTRDCKVTGINFNNYQLKQAKSRIKKSGLSEKITLKMLDIMEIDALKERFDGAVLIDVGCHLPDKEKAIGKIYNILKKNGRLVIMDWLQKENPSEGEKQFLVEPFNKMWNYPYMESVEGYNKIFESSGFKIIKSMNVSKETYRNWEFFYKQALKTAKNFNWKELLSIQANPMVLLKGKEALKETMKNYFLGGLFTKICADAGVFQYGYFVVEK